MEINYELLFWISFLLNFYLWIVICIKNDANEILRGYRDKHFEHLAEIEKINTKKHEIERKISMEKKILQEQIDMLNKKK